MILEILLDLRFWIFCYLIFYIFITIVYLSKKAREMLFNPNSEYDSLKRKIAGLISVFMFLIPPFAIAIVPQSRFLNHIVINMIGGTIFIIAFALNIAARRQIGYLPGLKIKGRLISTGIYSIIRHPIYLANSLLVIGWSILFLGIISVIFSVFYMLMYIPIIFMEEKILIKEYGTRYLEYKKRTTYAFIPKLF
jgi:protein-S-isoprenylcysteine O-methyltransferase Ste14